MTKAENHPAGKVLCLRLQPHPHPRRALHRPPGWSNERASPPAFPRCTMGRRRHVLALFHYFPPPPTHSPFSLRERHPTFRFHASTGGPSPHPINPTPHRNHLPAESARPRGRCSRVSRRKQPPPGGRRVRARSWLASRSIRQEKTSAPSRRPRTHEKIRARRRPLRSGRRRRTG